ncbi:acyltransferase [Desulfobacterales bacterium HSG16]|nr:acyltransferase [Desulfobacterales bacterium HSG16]
MRKDHRPYIIKKAWLDLQKWYARYFLKPQFDKLGKGCTFMRPWHVEIFGSRIELGKFATVIATSDKKIRLAVWGRNTEDGQIKIGNYCLISPGVRISAAEKIIIKDSCMFASRVYVTDSDWHDIYDRAAFGVPAPVIINENVWIGDGAVVCKGVNIGKNSVVGAGSVVTKNIPENVIAAGNPAVVIRHLDSEKDMKTRANWLSDPVRLAKEFDMMDRENLAGNSLSGWIRSRLFPRSSD